MKGLDRLLTTLGLIMGLCCLLAAATTYSAPSWLPLTVRDLMLSWGPLVCLLGVVVIGVTLTFPDLISVTSPRRTGVLAALLALGLVVAAVILLRTCLRIGA